MVISRAQEAGLISLVEISGVFEVLIIYHPSSILILNKLRSKPKGAAGERAVITIITNSGRSGEMGSIKHQVGLLTESQCWAGGAPPPRNTCICYLEGGSGVAERNSVRPLSWEND